MAQLVGAIQFVPNEQVGDEQAARQAAFIQDALDKAIEELSLVVQDWDVVVIVKRRTRREFRHG